MRVGSGIENEFPRVLITASHAYKISALGLSVQRT